MPTQNEALQFNGADPETALAAGEHSHRVSMSALSACEALLKQYGADAAAAYNFFMQSLEAEAAPIERRFEDNNEPEGLAPAA